MGDFFVNNIFLTYRFPTSRYENRICLFGFFFVCYKIMKISTIPITSPVLILENSLPHSLPMGQKFYLLILGGVGMTNMSV